MSNTISENHPFNRINNEYEKTRMEATVHEQEYKQFLHKRLYRASQIIKSVHNKTRDPLPKHLNWVYYINENFEVFNNRCTVNTFSNTIQMTYIDEDHDAKEVKKFDNISLNIIFMSDRDIAKATRQDIYRAKYRSLLVKIQENERNLEDEESLEKKILAKEKRMRTETEKRIKNMREEALKDMNQTHEELTENQRKLNTLKERAPSIRA